MPTILLSAPPQSPADDLVRHLAAAGHTVVDHPLGSAPAVDFRAVAAVVVDTGERADVAAGQTRRWRTELADVHVPVVWVLPFPSAELTAVGLDAGADVCLARPVDPTVFAAQVRAAVRAGSAFARQTSRAAEARLVDAQLQQAYARLDRELEMARRVHRAFLPRTLPEVGAVRFAVSHRPRSRVGGDFYDVARLDETHVGFVLADAGGHGSAAGSLLSVFVKQAVVAKEITPAGYRLVPPDEVLGRVNRELLALGLDDPPLVGMLVGRVDVRTGEVVFARAGLPPPLHVPAAGDPEAWPSAGPMLGAFDASFAVRAGRLAPGDALLIGTGEVPPNVAASHRERVGEAFVDAVARDVLAAAGTTRDFTLLAVEWVVNR